MLDLIFSFFAAFASYIFCHNGTLVFNIVVSDFDVTSHGGVGKDLAAFLSRVARSELGNSMRHFNLLDKVGTTLPYIETATNGHAAATAQNEQKDANSGKNGSSNGKCSLTGVILTAGLLIGQKAQCSNVLVFIGTAEETNKLIGLRKIDQLDIIVLARSANTKYLSTIRVENNSLDTVVIPRKANSLDVFSRAQIHS